MSFLACSPEQRHQWMLTGDLTSIFSQDLWSQRDHWDLGHFIYCTETVIAQPAPGRILEFSCSCSSYLIMEATVPLHPSPDLRLHPKVSASGRSFVLVFRWQSDGNKSSYVFHRQTPINGTSGRREMEALMHR